MRPIDADALRDSVLKWLPPDPCGQEDKEYPFETDICVSMLQEIEKAPTIEPEWRWIPCSERLPEEHGFYLVSVGSPYKHIRVYQYEPCTGYENENLWRGEDGSYCFNWFVEAWMPLPDPWKGDKE